MANWRRERDSNPRWSCPHTRFPGVRLQPLGHPSMPHLLTLIRGGSGRCSEAAPAMQRAHGCHRRVRLPSRAAGAVRHTSVNLDAKEREAQGDRPGHGRAGSHRGVSRGRGHRCRDPGVDRFGAAGLHRRGPAGQGGGRVARAGARSAGGARPGAAGAPHHGQPRPGGCVEGGQPFRPADRARPAGRDGGAAAGGIAGVYGARRVGARRLSDRGRRGPSRRAGRRRARQRHHLSG